MSSTVLATNSAASSAARAALAIATAETPRVLSPGRCLSLSLLSAGALGIRDARYARSFAASASSKPPGTASGSKAPGESLALVVTFTISYSASCASHAVVTAAATAASSTPLSASARRRRRCSCGFPANNSRSYCTSHNLHMSCRIPC